jgi:hypothetical protein
MKIIDADKSDIRNRKQRRRSLDYARREVLSSKIRYLRSGKENEALKRTNMPRFEEATASTQEKVATPKSLQNPNQKNNPKHKEPRLKVATFTSTKVAT